MNLDKIEKHLSRKKPIPTKQTNAGVIWKVSKPIIEYSEDGTILYCYYGKHYLCIRYDENCVYNPYKISIESQCVFASRQEIGVKYYEEVAPTQEDVIECIRYRLRS